MNRRAVDPPAAELAARPRSARVGNGIKRHVVGLRRALALLALPLLFIAIVGAGSLDLAPKLGVFAVAVGVVLRALADEEGWRSILNVLRAALGWRVLVPVIVVVAVGGLLVSHHEGTGFRDLYDTWSRALLLATAAFWIIATLLRLAWYAETPLRGLVALAILATAARIVAAVFFPDAGMSIVEGALWLALVGVAVAINAAGEVLIHPESRLEFLIAAGPPQRYEQLRRRSIDFALVTGFAFAGAALVGQKADPDVNRVKLKIETVTVHDDRSLATPPSSWLVPNQLAARFSPALELTKDERWAPIRVEDFVRAAPVHWSTGSLYGDGQIQDGAATAATLPQKCPSTSPSPCLYMTISCPIGDLDKSGCSHDTKRSEGYRRGGTAYVHTVVDGETPDQPFAAGISSVGPYAGKVHTIVEYWLFYYYDDWKADSLLGHVRQAHEGDWEAVAVGFSKTAPLFIALSAHCGGTWVPWEDAKVVVSKDSGSKPDGFHPLVAVAEGSHANYFDAKQGVPPDWAGCAHLHSRRASAASFAYRIRDRTGVYEALQLDDLVPADAGKPPMSFYGVWGKNGISTFTTFGGKVYSLPSDQNGPTSPPLHSLWYDPMGTIFCSETWEPRGSGRRGC